MQTINTGTAPNSSNGDTLRLAFGKINQNFQEIDASKNQLIAGTSTFSVTTSGSVIFPDGSEQTTAYIGQGGSIPVTSGDAYEILSNNGTNTFWTSTISLNHLTMSGDLAADTNEAYDIGSITSRWANVFVSNDNNQGLWIGNNIINISSTGHLLINGQIQGLEIDGGSANTIYSPSEISINAGNATSIYPSNELAINGGAA
jgi:hypothetical protein